MADPADRRHAGVLGRPIGHSLSPVIHNAGYAAAGLIGWQYGAYDCGEAELADFVAALDGDWAGLSLTMPLKRVGLTVAAEVSQLAETIGATNTLVRRPDSTWQAENTDAPGIVDALRDAVQLSTVENAAILGAGGTARAALAAVRSLEAAEVTLYARRSDPESLGELIEVSDRLGVVLRVRHLDECGEAGRAGVVICTLPAGAAEHLDLDWQTHAVLLDVAYGQPSRLVESARAAGCVAVSGEALLLAQAVRQFELFTAVPAPVAAMRSALAHAIDR